jgi:hypothetical protein
MIDAFTPVPRKPTSVVKLPVLEAQVRHSRGVSTDHARPALRGDCVPCPVCQAVRDHGELVGDDDRLACGHTGDEIIWHSRPCVFVGCRASAYLDVTKTGGIRFVHGDEIIDPLRQDPDRSCVIDIAEDGALTLEQAADIQKVTRERARQIEKWAIEQLLTLVKRFDED